MMNEPYCQRIRLNDFFVVHFPIVFFQAQESVDACCQRWFYGGKLLGDKILIEDAQIQPQYIVQVIVNTEHYNHGVTS